MIYIFFIVFIIFIRLYILKKAQSKAVDQWYWLKYRDVVIKQKKCPPNLPEYLLEVKQWYPPFFGWFLSKIPDNIFKYTNLLTQVLSIFRLSFIFIVAYMLDLELAFPLYLAIVVYLTAPILIYYDNQINSRIFGSLLVDILILSFFGYFEYSLFYLLIPIFILTTILLFTHKMSQQLYLFLLIGMTIFYMSVIPMLIYILSNLFAITFFSYKNYFKAHVEIVKFWHRNRYKLGAHQFYESDIYSKNDFVNNNRLHGNGIKSFIKKSSLIVGMLPFTIFVLFNFEFNFFGLIVFFTLLFIFLTSFVDRFLCLGSGNLYTYNLVTFICFYMLLTDINFSSFANQSLLILVLMMTVGSIYKFYRGVKYKSKDDEFDNAIEYINKSNLDRIIVIPFQLPDEVAYKTHKKVFWGGHGYGFLWLEPYFPVFNTKIEDAIQDWNLGAIFLKKDYYPEFFDRVDMNLFNIDFENEKYIVLSVKNWIDKDAIPLWAIGKYPDVIRLREIQSY